MKKTKHLARRSALALTLIVLAGCSSSTDTTAPTDPLQLALVSGYRAPGNATAAFVVQVSKNGVLLRGAKLSVQSDISIKVDTVRLNGANVTTDSLGEASFTYTFPANAAAVAIRAYKDTLASNFIRWP
mgnify:CR=1 FL=1